jgi:hypothetical protein
VQFEGGPLTEASIGNVGMRSERAGWTDHVITPTGGIVLLVGDDMIDRFMIRKLEDRIGSMLVRALLRTVLNPSRSVANVAALRAPWHRPDRPVRRP